MHEFYTRRDIKCQNGMANWQIVNYSNPYLVAKIQVTGHKMIRLLPRGIKIPGAIITF